MCRLHVFDKKLLTFYSAAYIILLVIDITISGDAVEFRAVDLLCRQWFRPCRDVESLIERLTPAFWRMGGI